MMTLEQVRNWHRSAQNDCQQTASSYFSGDDIGDHYQLMANEHKEMADAIDAHLAQQPDLVAIREVIAWHRAQSKTIRESENYVEGIADRMAARHDKQADKLARAIEDKP